MNQKAGKQVMDETRKGSFLSLGWDADLLGG